jgi:uncharacterized protein
MRRRILTTLVLLALPGAFGVRSAATAMPGAGFPVRATATATPGADSGTHARASFRNHVGAERVRPQEPKRPLPYDEHHVSFPSAGGVRLAGTLTLPRGPGRFPAVVLSGGTGRQDRDATIAGHRPFLVLADHLTRHGIAVLRFDERGVGSSTGDFAAATTLDFASDVLAAVRLLAAHPRIERRRIGLIGHSEGGMVAPIAANGTDDVAFIILLAAPGLPVRDIGPRQAERIALAEGAGRDEVAARVQLSSSILALFAEDLDDATLRARARPVLENGFARLQLSPAARERQIELALDYYASPWAQFALRYDPRPALRTLRVPVLALNGGLDVQVDAARNLAAIAAALAAGSAPQVTTRELPGLNHLFQTARTGALSEYAGLDETFSPLALHLISDWVMRAAQ